MHSMPINRIYRHRSEEGESFSGGRRGQTAFTLRYARVPRLQVNQLLRFRRTHTPRRLLAEGACWEYFLGGRGNEVILLLPGGACLAEWNFERILALERSYTVISPSDPAGVYTMEQIVRGVSSILEYEGMRRVHLIGISLGGMEAQCFVRAYPHLVQSLMLCQMGAPTPSSRLCWEPLAGCSPCFRHVCCALLGNRQSCTPSRQTTPSGGFGTPISTNSSPFPLAKRRSGW